MITMTKALGFAALAGLLVLAAPVERASALSLVNPGIAAAVQGETATGATEVRWHRGWHRRHHWHRRHWRHRRW
jgi:hypothetical protein